MEHGATFVMTSPRTSAGIVEETTFIMDKEEVVATTVKRVYLTPKLVFNNKVELSTTITPYQKNSQMNTITATNDADGNSSQDLNENTRIKIPSKTIEDEDQNNLLSKTASTMVGKTTTGNMPVNKVHTYDIKSIFPATSRAPMPGAESSSVSSPISSESSGFTTFLTGELLPANKSSNDDSKV